LELPNCGRDVVTITISLVLKSGEYRSGLIAGQLDSGFSTAQTRSFQGRDSGRAASAALLLNVLPNDFDLTSTPG
jgi:hypothetical protein